MAIDKITNNPPPLAVVDTVNKLVEFGGQIVEQSGNSVRFANGIQVSFGFVTTSSDYGFENVVFSLPFKGNPGIGVTPTVLYKHNMSCGFDQNRYLSTEFSVRTFLDGEPYSATVSWIAIGKWK